jgi:conjugal transfer pilus assembly protein TraB
VSNNIAEKLRSKFKTEEGYQRFLKIMLWGTLGLIFIVFIFLMFHQSAPVKKKKANFAKIINKKKFQKEQWILQAQGKLNRLESHSKKSKAEISLLKKEVHDEALIEQSKKTNVPAAGQPGARHVFNPPIPGLPNNNQQTNYRPARPVKQVPTTITEVTNPINVILNSVPYKKKNKVKKKRKPTGFYIPAGAFTEGLLLNGLDAPASMKGKSNPYPTLIRLTNLSFLPNRYRLSMKGCFVLAEGYGSLSSERVYLRTVDLSCIVKNGQGHISAPIKGYIVGAHGKVGLRGKVVTKQGAILAREFVAGLLQGFGSVVQQQSQMMSYSALGATSTINPSHIGESGIGQGLGTAAGELSKFYSKMASSMMPVVVVGAGRKLTLVLTHGFYATFKKNVTYSKNLKNNIKKKGVKK